MIFVDTNYFLRFLLKDIDRQHAAVKKLFLAAAAGKQELLTSTIVMFEIYWVLSSYYDQKRSEVASVLHDVLALTFIVLPEREHLQESVELFRRTTLSLEDCYNVVFARSHNVREFKTFDRKLARHFSDS